MPEIVYVADTLEVQFEAKRLGTPRNLSGAKLVSTIKKDRNDPDPGVLQVKNAAAGGSDQDVYTSDAANGKFSAFFDAATLVDDAVYVVDGRGRLADGKVFTAGEAEFRVKKAVTNAPPAP
jgi:hypothetical protein